MIDEKKEIKVKKWRMFTTAAQIESQNYFQSQNILMIKVWVHSNGNTRIMCEICSKLRIKAPERRQWSVPGVF